MGGDSFSVQEGKFLGKGAGGGEGKTGTRGVARITKESCTITSRFIGFILIPLSGSCLNSTVGLREEGTIVVVVGEAGPSGRTNYEKFLSKFGLTDSLI